MSDSLTRRKAITGFLALSASTAFTGPRALAKGWPEQAIKFVVGGAAGSVPDTLARIAGDTLSKAIGKPVIVENRPGGGGIAAMQGVIGSSPDGYTIGLATISQIVFNQYLYSKLPYDPRLDLLPISKLAASSFILAAHPSVSADTLADLIALSGKEPDKLLIGIPANGAPPHVAAILLLQKTGLRASFIPFKSGPDALRATIRGDVHLLMDGPTLLSPQVAEKSLKALVATGRRRNENLPNVPTVTEAGYPDAEFESWMGLVVPRGTPPSVVADLGRECQEFLKNEEYSRKLKKISFIPQATTPEEFVSLIDREHQRWSTVIQKAGLKLG